MVRAVLSLISVCVAFAWAAGPVEGAQDARIYAPFDTLEDGASPARGVADKAFVSGAALGEGVVGKGLVLDGREDAAVVMDPPRTAPVSALTAEAWVRLRRRPEGRGVVVGETAAGRGQGQWLLGVGADGRPFAEIHPQDGTRVALSSPSALETHRLYHLALAFDGDARRVQLRVNGRPADVVWLPARARLSGEGGRVWIGWGPRARRGDDTTGLAGMIDEVVVSDADTGPSSFAELAGMRMDADEWRQLVVQARLAFDRFRGRAAALVRANVLDAPQFVSWRLANAEHWLARREADPLRRALAHCERTLCALEASGDAGGASVHPSPPETIPILPENTVDGDAGRFTFRARRVGETRVDVAVTGASSDGALTILCARDRCRFLGPFRWSAGADARTYATRVDVPVAEGEWKLCVLDDPGIVALDAGGREVFRTSGRKARAGASVSVYDLAGTLSWGEQDVAVQVAKPGRAPGVAYLVRSPLVSYARRDPGAREARALAGGPRVTVLARDADGTDDRAFVEVFGDLPLAQTPAIRSHDLSLGCASSRSTLVSPCELLDMLAAVRAIGGNALALPFGALAETAERRGGVTLTGALESGREADVQLVVSLAPEAVDAFLSAYGEKSPDDAPLRIALAGADRASIEAARKRLSDAGLPAARVFAPEKDAGFSDGRALLSRVGRAPDEARVKDDALAPLPTREAIGKRLGNAGEPLWLWRWSPRLPSARCGPWGSSHPEALLLETVLFSRELGIGAILVDMGDRLFGPLPDHGGDVLSTAIDRRALLAACLARTHGQGLEVIVENGDALVVQGGGVDLVAALDAEDAASERLAFWRARGRRPGDPCAILAADFSEGGKAGQVVAALQGGLLVKRRLDRLQHVYAVNVFGARAYDCAFANLGGEGVVLLVPDDPGIAYLEWIMGSGLKN